MASDNTIYWQGYNQPTYVYAGTDAYSADQGTEALTCTATTPGGADGPGVVTCTDGVGAPSTFQTCTNLGDMLLTYVLPYENDVCSFVTLTGVCV